MDNLLPFERWVANEYAKIPPRPVPPLLPPPLPLPPARLIADLYFSGPLWLESMPDGFNGVSAVYVIAAETEWGTRWLDAGETGDLADHFDPHPRQWIWVALANGLPINIYLHVEYDPVIRSEKERTVWHRLFGFGLPLASSRP